MKSCILPARKRLQLLPRDWKLVSASSRNSDEYVQVFWIFVAASSQQSKNNVCSSCDFLLIFHIQTTTNLQTI